MKIGKINIVVAFGLTMIIMILNSCVDMQELNYDKKRLTDELLSIDANDGGFSLPSMQTGIIDATGNAVRYEFLWSAPRTISEYITGTPVAPIGQI